MQASTPRPKRWWKPAAILSIAGGLMLWPRGFRSVDTWLARRWPWLHRQGSEQLIRYLDDMERRYPTGR